MNASIADIKLAYLSRCFIVQNPVRDERGNRHAEQQRDKKPDEAFNALHQSALVSAAVPAMSHGGFCVFRGWGFVVRPRGWSIWIFESFSILRFTD
jgi:hypothetical protein